MAASDLQHARDHTAEAALRGDEQEPSHRAPRGRYGAQNIVVLAAQTFAWAATLTAIDHAPHPLLVLPLLVFFCFLLQGVFSMMHEFFHQNAHGHAAANYAIGLWGSTLFGTSATLHQVQHWGHHVRNRTISEQGEFIHSGESPTRKVLLYYFATLGGLWVGGLIFPVLALFLPYRVAQRLTALKRFNTYSAAFDQFTGQQWTRMRFEAVALIAFWLVLVLAGFWRPATIALAYAAFAFSWSSLQWIYHLHTPLDVVEGAWNLRLPTVGRWLFLNFNCNLTHHRAAHIPWQELYAHTDTSETQPLWYRWLAVFKPPRHKPADLSYLEKQYF